VRLHNFTAGALTDQGSNGQALTNNGAALAVAGADGTLTGAFSFSGTQSLSATDAGLPGGTAARSYGCWLKSTLVSGAGTAALSWGGAPGSADTRLLLGNGLLLCSSAADTITGPFVSDGQWHLAIAVEDNAAGDGVRRKLYVDGRLVGVSTVMSPITLTGANRFRVGAYTDGTRCSRGSSTVCS
jgi:hypothetical protein